MTDPVHVPGLGQSHGARDDEAAGKGGPREGGHTKADRELRRLFIAEMLLAHIPYRTIARNLTEQGWPTSKSTVAKEVAKIRTEWRERHQQAFDAHVEEQLGEIEALERAVLPVALHGGMRKTVSLGAVDRALMLMDRKARLLGLDQPAKIEATVVHRDLDAEKARGLELVDEVGRQRDRKAG